jgi:hypothetical protein
MASVRRFALHRAVISHDVEQIHHLLDVHHIDVDERDARGIPALHYAVHLGYKDVVELLIQKGADPTRRNSAGWSTIQEAIATSNKAMVSDILYTIHKKVNREYTKRLPALVTALKNIPDFYMEMKWEFHSWVPLVSRLCPSDCYKIYKGGSCFRVDTTLVGFENLKWIRGDVSFLFVGDGDMCGDVLVLDHKKQTIERAFTANTNCDNYTMNPDSLNPHELDIVMTRELIRTQPVVDHVVFTPSKTWLGYDKRERVGDWNSQVFEFSSFEMKIMNRKKTKQKPIENGHEADHKINKYIDTRQELLEGCDIPPADKPQGLLFPNEVVSEKSKPFKGSMWLSKEFPRSVSELIPIFEVLAPTHKHFDKLNQFITMKLPDGFPVKLEIPVFPTVSAVVTFLRCTEMAIDKSKFDVPSNYTVVDVKQEYSKLPNNNNDVQTNGAFCDDIDEDELFKLEDKKLLEENRSRNGDNKAQLKENGSVEIRV